MKKLIFFLFIPFLSFSQWGLYSFLDNSQSPHPGEALAISDKVSLRFFTNL